MGLSGQLIAIVPHSSDEYMLPPISPVPLISIKFNLDKSNCSCIKDNEFNKIINDFISDIITTFPEYNGLIKRWWTRTVVSEDDSSNPRAKAEISFVFRHCVKVLPERFFDILYMNNDIFSENSEVNTEFLPGIVFKQLWACDISDNTRETIWKYLQLILFSVIGTVHNSSELGDTAKLFEAINDCPYTVFDNDNIPFIIVLLPIDNVQDVPLLSVLL